MRKTLARRTLAVLLTLAMILSLAPAMFAAAPAPTIRLNRATLSLAAGREGEIRATVTNPVAGAEISWSVSDILEDEADRVVKLSSYTGEVITITAQNGGTVTVTASYKYTPSGGGTETTITATCEVTVTAAVVTKLEPSVADKEINFGESATLRADVKAIFSDDPDGRDLTEQEMDRRLTWTAEVSDGSSVEVLLSSGRGRPSFGVRGIRPGESTIKVKVTYKNVGGQEVTGETTCTVTVGDKTEVIITEYGVNTSEVHMKVGESYQTNGRPTPYKELGAYLAINGKRAETSNIEWSLVSGDAVSIAQSDGVVRVTPEKEGRAVLRATDKTANVSSDVLCVVSPQTSTGPSNPDDPGVTTDAVLPENVKAEIIISVPKSTAGDPYVMDPGTTNIELEVNFTKGHQTTSGQFVGSQSGNVVVVYTDSTEKKEYELPLTWNSADSAKVSVSGNRFILSGNTPGQATLTATLQDKNDVKATANLYVEVKGFSRLKEEVSVYENGSLDLVEDGIIGVYGGANISELSCWSDDSTVAGYVDGKVAAYSPGKTTFHVSDPKRGFRTSFEVEVKADPDATIPKDGTITIKSTETLEFADLLSSFRRQAGGKLSHITGINLNSDAGGVYYKYNSSTKSGTGVGAESYYHPYRSGGVPTGGRSLEELTFVPRENYAGLVEIKYTGVSEEGKSYVCQLRITVDPQSGSKAGISHTTDYNTPLKFSGDDFNRVCRERLGSRLNYVTFSQPPERQGTLYTNYVAAGNYGSRVGSEHYNQKKLDDVWFVPAPGYSGPVTVYYTAFGVDGKSFAGQVDITVKPENGVAIGGLTFDTSRGGVARFDDERFNSYCREALHEDSWYDRQTLSHIRIDALPSAAEGVLYYDYRSASSTGTRAAVGTSYYYGTRSPRIDRLTFVPAADFVGTVKIPFTGWTSDGTRFTGNVEINVRGGSGYGDIWYVCAPGRSVSFRSSDFTSLCRDLTGRTISYIIIRGLPGTSDGSLYYNNTRITTTGVQYQNSSISRLSFRAASSFSGVVDIPFEGRSTGGEVFNGVVTISTSASSGSGSSVNWGNICYTASANTAALFDEYDFDDLSRWETGRSVSSVRFQVPSASQGDLYRNYRSSSNQGTRISSSGTSISRSGLDQVAFVPARNYTGTVYIDFTATAENGILFDGTVEITVERGTVSVVTPDPTTTPTSVRFSDVASNAYYADAVRWAVNSGITSGTSSTTFSPNQTCTVAQILSFLYRANGSPRVTGSNPFTDVRTSDYYYEAALWAHQKGLVSGSAFKPYSPCTRSMVVTYLWKLAGQPSPAARPLSYAPYTLSGSQEYGNFTLRFDAAVTAKTRITLHRDNDEIGYIDRDFEPAETYDVTLIAVRPGSGYTIGGGFYGYTYASDSPQWFNGVPGSLYFRASDGSFRYTLTQTGHDDSEFALFNNSLSWFRENGRHESITGNNGSADCGALIKLNGEYYFVTYADSAISGGLISGSAGFSDVSSGASYAQAVAWATEQKITSGTSKTTFSPDNTCTRGQIVTFLYRAMGW